MYFDIFFGEPWSQKGKQINIVGMINLSWYHNEKNKKAFFNSSNTILFVFLILLFTYYFKKYASLFIHV